MRGIYGNFNEDKVFCFYGESVTKTGFTKVKF